jgi:hypothetical protein
MGVITAIAVMMLIYSFINLRVIFTKRTGDNTFRNINGIKELGLLAFILGVLASTLDLMGAFGAIKLASNVSMAVLAGGLQLTFIPMIYGLIVYLLALLIRLGIHWKMTQIVTK